MMNASRAAVVLLALALAPVQSSRAAVPVAASTATAPVQAEVEASTTATVGSIYTVDRMRDPFAKGGTSKVSSRPFSIDDFSIHKLSLRGIMKDPASDFALFSDNEFQQSFLLRKGKLYDDKNKPVPSVGGSIDVKAKMVTLTAAEGDVQVFRLGEEEKE